MAQLDESKYLKSGSTMYCFAGYPSVKIYKNPTGSPWSEHLLFGDYIKILDPEINNKRIRSRSRNSNGWVKVSEIQTERVLEVNFIDIGQGDGCHIVTPDDRHILIDAGEYDNMNRYLTWRFNLYGKTRPLAFPFKVVISHSDRDHYGGFKPIFENEKIRISEIYHNGIVERPGEKETFGKIENGLITSLVTDTEEMLEIITDPSKRKGKGSTYPKTLYSALKHNPSVQFKMVSEKDAFLNGFDKQYFINDKDFNINVLGPIIEEKNGKVGLRSIDKGGKDKNGHSVLLKLVYGRCRILLGGDINEEFGKLIIEHLEATDSVSKLQVDAAKACHHGSNHFHYEFLQAINSAATVISSGDDESYCHPRPDALGAFGKCGYGDKPLIFSTEIARSNKDITRKSIAMITKLFADNESLGNLQKELTKAGVMISDPALKSCNSKLTLNNKKINSFLTKYGMINLRTDGQIMIIAQKLERPASYGKWDIHRLEYSEKSGRFELIE